MEKKNSYTLKLTQLQENKLYEAWKESASTPPQYAKWQLRPENCVITCYSSGKTLFQGSDAFVYASPFMNDETPAVPAKTARTAHTAKDQLPQAGSDEVGTGDYFGPVCVCAAYVDETTADRVRELGVRDSKALTDTDILKIGAELMELLPHSLLIVSNHKYNQVHESNNMNQIKARLHNQAYINLANKHPLPSLLVVDQFAPEGLYYRYLQKEQRIVRGILFETKAEDKYIAVGAASVIARYAFLKCMEQLKERYGMEFHKGAGPDVDKCASRFVGKFGMERLGEVAKLHFKNTEKLK